MHRLLKSVSLAIATLLIVSAFSQPIRGTTLRISHRLAQAQGSQDRKTQAYQLLEQGIEQIDAGQPEAALEYLQQALIIYREIRDRQGEGQVLKNLGNAYYLLKDYEQSKEYQQRALLIARELQDRDLEARTLNNLGNAYKGLGESAKAIELYQQALTLAQEIQSRQLELIFLGNLTATYRSLEDYPKAIEFAQQALKIARELQDPEKEWKALGNLSLVYNALQNAEKAVEYLQQALVAVRAIQNQNLELVTLNYLGSTYISLNEYSQAIDLAQQALVLARELQNTEGEWSALTTLISAYNSLKDYQKVIEYAQQALSNARTTQNQHREGDTLNRLAGTYNALKDYQKAIEIAQQALAIAQEIKNPELEVKALWSLAQAYELQEDYETTIKLVQQILAVARKNQNQELEAAALIVLGGIYSTLTEYQKTIELTQQGLGIAQQLQNRYWEARALMLLGSTYNFLGDYQQALELTQQGLTIAQEQQARDLEASALNVLSSIYFYLAKYQKAIELAQQSLGIAQELKSTRIEIGAISNLSRIYWHLGNYEESTYLSQQYVSIGREIKQSSWWEARSLNLMAFNYFGQGDYQKAIHFSEQALERLPELKNVVHANSIKYHLFLILCIGYGSLGEYEKAVELAQESLMIVREQQHRYMEGHALNALGSIYSKSGQKQKAIESYREALAIANQTEIASAALSSQAGLARLYRDLNMPITAITYYKQAINSIEQVRSNIQGLSGDLQKSFLQSIQTFAIDKAKPANIYRELADLLLSQERFLEAQQVLELLKVEELRDFTRNSSVGGKKPEVEFTQTEEKIKQEHGTLIAFGQKIDECQKTRCSQLSQLLDQRDVLTAQFDQTVQQLEQEIRTRRSQYEGFLDPTKFSSNVQKIIDAQPGTVVIYPFVQEDKIWLLWATKGGIVKSEEVPNIGRQQLGETVLKFRQLLQDRFSDVAELQATSKQLYDWLIKPLEAELKANKINNLVFSLDRVTRYIPMSALFDGEKYLVANYTISTILSADLTDTSTPSLAGTQDTSVLALGLSEAVAGFNPLPNVPKELDAIVRLDDKDSQGIYPGLEFLNQNFDYRALRDNLYGKKILHIATHGEFVPGLAYESYLLLGTGEKLAIPEIKKLQDLGNVQLVVLSACETALGEAGQDGNEINGISFYFLNQGAKAVLASLWNVNDTSTSQLMQQFYRNLTQETPTTKAQALRQAQLSLLQGDTSGSGVQNLSNNSTAPSFSHPYYWAPFILIGNGL